MSALINGLLTGLSLIVAIGAQNAFVLRTGLTRRDIGLVVFLCSAADALLIAVGVAGLGRVVESAPSALNVFRWFGVLYLSYFAVTSLRRARHAQVLVPSERPVATRRNVVATTLAFTFLNPHVYLDTVLLLGSIGTQYGAHRWWFATGAITASVLWFSSLGFGARFASRWTTSVRAWRVIDVVIALIVLAVAARLATMHLATMGAQR